MERQGMPGFFETLAMGASKGPLMAVWVIEGAAAGAKALFAFKDGRWLPVCRDAAFPEALAGEIGGLAPGQSGILERGGARLFLEPIAAGRRLVICGAGHVALCVIRVAATLGFEITAIEDRAAFAEKAREAGAGRVLCKPFAEALDEIPGDATTAFVVMTREHVHDVDCLRRILQKPCAYAGMMGSRGRSARIRQMLLEEGFDARRVAALRMPIGVPIGARTPEEIAISVAAELISVMNASESGEGFPPGVLEALTHPDGPAVLAMIVDKRGEAPRRPGTKMLIRPDGSFLGTAGGGTVEAEVLRAAGAMLREGCQESRLLRLELKKGVVQCGGEIEILLLPV